MTFSHDILRRIETDFPLSGHGRVLAELAQVDTTDWPVDHDRVLLAILTLANGSLTQLTEAIRLADEDWRVALTRVGPPSACAGGGAA